MKTAMQELFEKIHSPNMSLTDAWEWLMNNEKELLDLEDRQLGRKYAEGFNVGKNTILNEVIGDIKKIRQQYSF